MEGIFSPHNLTQYLLKKDTDKYIEAGETVSLTLHQLHHLITRRGGGRGRGLTIPPLGITRH